MLWTIMALILMAAMGGVIAYYGDLQGRRWGKRRVSIFGLRPRHTAILITIVTGFFISTFTILILFMAIPTVREIILEGEQAIRMRSSLERQNHSLKQTEALLGNRIQNLNMQLSDTQQMENNERVRLGEVHQQLRLESQKLALISERMMLADRKLYIVQTDLSQATVRLSRVQARANQLKKRNMAYSEANSELARQSYSLMRDKLNLDQENQLLLTRNNDLSQQNATLEKTKSSLNKSVVSLADAVKKLINQKISLVSENDQLASKNNDLTKQLKLREQELAATSVFGENVGAELVALRQNPIIYGAGDELGRITIPPHQSYQQIKRKVEDFLHQCSLTALAQGAAIGNNALAVKIEGKQLVEPVGGGGYTSIKINEQESIDALAQQITDSGTSTCIVAVVVRNTAANQQVTVELHPYVNQIIFRKGQTVARAVLNGDRQTSEVFQDLVHFLQKDVRDVALKAGIIPRIKPDSSTPEVGTVSAGDLAALTEKIRLAGRAAQITAIASRNTDSADLLHLQFNINGGVDSQSSEITTFKLQ